MITGVVKSDEARIRPKVKGPRRREQEVEAVIDTGYTASLTLPPSLVAALGLRWQSLDRGTLTNQMGSAVTEPCIAAPKSELTLAPGV